MKVSELQELLKKYEPDTQVIVAIWDKECFKAMDTEERLVTDKEWDYVAEKFNVGLHDLTLGASIRNVLENEIEIQNKKTDEFISDYMASYLAGVTDEQLWDSPTTKKGEQ
jgi:hypothetical protein